MTFTKDLQSIRPLSIRDWSGVTKELRLNPVQKAAGVKRSIALTKEEYNPDTDDVAAKVENMASAFDASMSKTLLEQSKKEKEQFLVSSDGIPQEVISALEVSALSGSLVLIHVNREIGQWEIVASQVQSNSPVWHEKFASLEWDEKLTLYPNVLPNIKAKRPLAIGTSKSGIVLSFRPLFSNVGRATYYSENNQSTR
jgi:hypothetical protein